LIESENPWTKTLSIYDFRTNQHFTLKTNPLKRSDLDDFVSCFNNPETGKPFVDLKAGFKLACKKAGIAGVTWHTLRHTFASRLVDRGVDIVTVKELLGHSSITVTMRYTHTNLESKRAAVEKLLHHGCDKSVTVCTTVQQSKSALSQNRVLSYNAARS
jgi:hypothetical protein